MNKSLCFLMFVVNPMVSMTYLPPNPESKVAQIDEVFTPINKDANSTAGEISGPTIFDDMDDKNIILDINDPRVQEVIKRMVSMSIHEAFKNKELQKELDNKKKCCTSSTKLKVALLTASFSTATAIITIILNNM